jgi:hypothetical protein
MPIRPRRIASRRLDFASDYSRTAR